MKNWNSSINQEIKGAFVGREVIHSASGMMYELNNTDAFRDEICELFYSTPNYEQTKENYIYDLVYEEILVLLEEFGVESLDDIDAEELCDKYSLDYDYYEPYEFWIVTDWLGDKLKEKGEIVQEFMGFTIWGRLTTGQAILLDSVISKICEDLDLLKDDEN